MLEYGFNPDIEVHCSLDQSLLVLKVPDFTRIFGFGDRDKISIANSEVGILAFNIEACDILHAFLSAEDGYAGGTRLEIEYAIQLRIPVQVHWENGISQWIFQDTLNLNTTNRNDSGSYIWTVLYGYYHPAEDNLQPALLPLPP